MTLTLRASSPLRPGAISNSTSWPASRVRKPVPCTLEWWTKTSSPSGRDTKPYPFSALKNFTVPVDMIAVSPSLLVSVLAVLRCRAPVATRRACGGRGVSSLAAAGAGAQCRGDRGGGRTVRGVEALAQAERPLHAADGGMVLVGDQGDDGS